MSLITEGIKIFVKMNQTFLQSVEGPQEISTFTMLGIAFLFRLADL